jgi:hypothetical protein
MRKLLLASTLLASIGTTSAYASGSGTLADPFTGTGQCDSTGSFCIGSPDADDVKQFLDEGKNTNEFFGSITGNGSHFTDSILINTMGYVDTSSGFATIKPIKDGTLTQLDFTPQAKAPVDGFFSRGQLVFTQPDPKCGKSGHPACLVAPTSSNVLLQINAGPIFAFNEPIPESNDFDFIGVDEPNENEALAKLITHVTMWVSTPNVSFFEVKQEMWSPCSDGSGCGVVINPTGGGAPEPGTWLMGILGVGFVAGVGAWKRKHPLSIEA